MDHNHFFLNAHIQRNHQRFCWWTEFLQRPAEQWRVDVSDEEEGPDRSFEVFCTLRGISASSLFPTSTTSAPALRGSCWSSRRSRSTAWSRLPARPRKAPTRAAARAQLGHLLPPLRALHVQARAALAVGQCRPRRRALPARRRFQADLKARLPAASRASMRATRCRQRHDHRLDLRRPGAPGRRGGRLRRLDAPASRVARAARASRRRAPRRGPAPPPNKPRATAKRVEPRAGGHLRRGAPRASRRRPQVRRRRGRRAAFDPGRRRTQSRVRARPASASRPAFSGEVSLEEIKLRAGSAATTATAPTTARRGLDQLARGARAQCPLAGAPPSATRARGSSPAPRPRLRRPSSAGGRRAGGRQASAAQLEAALREAKDDDESEPPPAVATPPRRRAARRGTRRQPTAPSAARARRPRAAARSARPRPRSSTPRRRGHGQAPEAMKARASSGEEDALQPAAAAAAAVAARRRRTSRSPKTTSSERATGRRRRSRWTRQGDASPGRRAQ